MNLHTYNLHTLDLWVSEYRAVVLNWAERDGRTLHEAYGYRNGQSANCRLVSVAVSTVLVQQSVENPLRFACGR